VERDPLPEVLAMRWTKTIGWAGFAALFMPLFASCAHSAEGFCDGWVEDTCQAITGCCAKGEQLDLEACRIQLSDVCQQQFDVEKIHSGEYVFDSGAASACAGDIKTCDDFLGLQTDSYDHRRACANALTGFRAVGTACDNSAQCQKTGDFATCFKGSGGSGICAQVVLADDHKCSFSFETNELHICPDGTYCDYASFEPDPALPPTQRAFEFSAPCKNPVAAGGKCLDPAAQTILPCADGLYCDYSNGFNSAVCAKVKGAGASCNGNNECATGLSCSYDPQANGQVCIKGSTVPYCFTPVVCGDGTCDPGETPTSCPQDCGANGFCGDGNCDQGEINTCPQDCGGGSCTDTCAAGITDGGPVCAGTSSANLYDFLVSCAQGSCPAECSSFIQNQAPLNATCGSCLQTNCGTELTDCANDA